MKFSNREEYHALKQLIHGNMLLIVFSLILVFLFYVLGVKADNWLIVP